MLKNPDNQKGLVQITENIINNKAQKIAKPELIANTVALPVNSSEKIIESTPSVIKAYSQLKENEKRYFFDLEDPAHLDQFKNLKTTLEPLNGLIVIDEIQRQPEIFPYLRALADYSNKKFLILGSASGELLRQSSESLASRIEYTELTPFNLIEINDFRELWLRGGFPKSYLAKNYVQSLRWRK
ncbi:AAA family ATPase [Rickettsia rhipicephali]|uniref:AAA family ATPase n=1 Tax=Rickettsia rhipicephali TaxID=33992 RepID=UPI002F419067